MTNDLMIQEPIEAKVIFAEGGAQPILAVIRKQVDVFEADVTTAAGRKEVAAMAYKISRSKTFLEELGKEEKSGLKKKVDVIDGERKILKDGLDEMRDEVRQPLTDFEKAEETRIAKHEAHIQEIKDRTLLANEQWQTLDIKTMHERLEHIHNIPTDEEYWEEYLPEAQEVIIRAINALQLAIEKRTKYDEEQLELDRLRKEEAARQAERDHIENERIANEQAETRRKADVEHRGKTNLEAIEALVAAGIDQPLAENVIDLIAAGAVPHVTINY